MSLNKIIAEVTEAHESDGVINRQAAINDAVPQVLADAEMTQMCVRGHVSKLIANNVKSRAREDKAADSRQVSFFGLRDSYVVDDDEGQIKRTAALTRVEFEGLIIRRHNQVLADMAQLTKLRAAYRATDDIWAANPAWTWGDVQAEYARKQARAA